MSSHNLAWAAVVVAGLLEIGWAVGFKYAFRSNHLITAATLAAMWASFGLLLYAVRSLPIGTAYAVWTGIGAVGAATIGVLFLREPATAMRLLSIGLIVGGIVGLRLSQAAPGSSPA